MTKWNWVVCLMLLVIVSGAIAEEHDYYKYLRYPAGLVPGAGRNKVTRQGGADAGEYKRRTVQWWPRKGQDIVDIPSGAPLRTWTRNKGQKDAEAQAGVCRTWTASDPETFKAHLIGFRSFGTSTYMSDNPRSVLIPGAVLRLENGEQRAIIDYGPFSYMVSAEDHTFIHQTWEKAYPRLYAKVTQGDLPRTSKLELKRLKDIAPKFNGIEPAKDSKYPLWATAPDTIEIESPHFHTIAHPKAWGRPANWVNPDNIQHQNRYRKHVLEFLENFWTYVEAAGASMPYWRRTGPSSKYQIHIWRARCAGGWGHCGIGDANTVAFGHEFFHGQPLGGGGADVETMCNAGQHTAHAGELQMFNGNFRYPWRYVNYMGYQSSLWLFVLGDNPNWGYGIQVVVGCLASPAEPTAYHTIARLGQKKGLWKNGVKGFGDFFGEYAARMVTCDFVERYSIQSKYGMPEMSCVYPVYGHKNRYRISNAEAPRWCGYNIIRLKADRDAKEITVDFHGIHDPELYSDWRACIVASDGAGRARYSPLWNKGKMAFALKPSDKQVWLTVAATPSAFPVPQSGVRASYRQMFLAGVHAPRYPWEATFGGCRPGTPHRRQGDVVNFDELFGRCDSGNTYLNYSVKHETPIPLDETDGKLAREKLAEMLPRLKASIDALEAKVQTGRLNKGYFWDKRHMMHIDLERRIKLLQKNAKGRRHTNGGGFVANGARVAATAYVGPNAMVFDGATVKDNACIKDFAVVLGPKTVISGNAKIGGRAWVVGDLKVAGNARILEAATVTTILRTPRTPSVRHEGRAEITGSAVIKGEPYLFLCYADDVTLNGGIVLDYEAAVEARSGGVFSHGRFHRWSDRRVPSFSSGLDAGALYADWRFNQPKSVLLEDSYVNNNGDLHGRPEFGIDGEHKYIVFNGKDQYAQAPPSVADFAELTIDMMVNRSGGGRIFDFGTGDDECFHLAIDPQNGKPTLTARHAGKIRALSTSQGMPAGKWVRLRVEMDGSNASIHIDGKSAAKSKFEFSPRDVFIGDRPEGNFIACGRDKKGFFKGRLDHFRIYRKVHADFDALGPPPRALIRTPEWSPEDQKLHDDWEGRKTALQARLDAGKYGQIQDEIKQLGKRKSDMYKVKSEKLKELEARAKQASKAISELDRKMRDEYRSRPETVRTEREIKEMRSKIDAVRRSIRKSGEYVKIVGDIKTCETRRREIKARNPVSPELKKMENRIRRLRKDLNALTAKLEKSNAELNGLNEAVRARQDALNATRKQIENRHRSADAYKKAQAKQTAADLAARKTRDEDRRRIEQSKEFADLGARIAKLQTEANALRNIALKKACLFGSNPYPGAEAARRQALRKQFKYYTTADWDGRIQGEGKQAPPKMMKWLLRVRGY